MADVTSATRRVPKATYVPLIIPMNTSSPGGAIAKFAFLRQLALQPGEVAAAEDAQPAPSVNDSSAKLLAAIPWSVLRMFEGSPLPSQLPSPSLLAPVTSDTLLAFGNAIKTLRRQALASAKPEDLSKQRNLLNIGTVVTQSFENAFTVTPLGMLNLERVEMTPAGVTRGELIATIPLAPMEQTAVIQQEWSWTSQDFTSVVKDSLDNFSATGVTDDTELAQSTTTQVQHNNQFNITTTASGNYPFVSASASSGFTAQDAHSQSATDSVKHAVATTRQASSRVKQSHKVTISTKTVTGTSQTTTRTLSNPSPTDPMRIDYFSMMRKWRVGLYRYGLRLTYDLAIPEPGGALRQAYMLLDDLSTQAGAPFSFKLPASALTETPNSWQDLADQWGAQLSPPPGGKVVTKDAPTDGLSTNDDAWHMWTATFQVDDGYQVDHVGMTAMLGANEDAPRANILDPNSKQYTFSVIGTDFGVVTGQVYWPNRDPKTGVESEQYVTLNAAGAPFLAGGSGEQSISYMMQYVAQAKVSFSMFTVPSEATMNEWIQDSWIALYNAAQTAYYANQQSLNAQIAQVQASINDIDTLTLRREENDEIMKGVLRWMLGPTFDFMPQDVVDLYGSPDPKVDPVGYDRLVHGVAFTGNDLAAKDVTLSATNWATMFQYGEMVKFVNEAIEWENVLYFLYSYFWDVPESWEFIRQIRHPDATRQAFLRAGSARVVLTIRPGYELAWVSFVETGGFGEVLTPNHPYVSVAQEMMDYANTNYPGIPPANPAANSEPDDGAWAMTSSKMNVKASGAPVTLEVASNTGFLVGYTVVIDTYNSIIATSNAPAQASAATVTITVDSSAGFIVGQIATIDATNPSLVEQQVITGKPDPTHITVEGLTNSHYGNITPFSITQNIQEAQIITDIPSDTTHITLRQLQYPHDGSVTQFSVLQPGEKGALIAEWYEYTPTSGTDISVTIQPATVNLGESVN
jgi:hypothetical protein